MNHHPGGISHAIRLNELRRKSGMQSLLASRLTQLPGQSMYHKHAERFTDSIIKRAQKKPAYAKPILELTPEDIADATTLYVVKTRVMYGKKSTDTYVDGHGVEKNRYGNNVYYLPDSESHKYRRRLDVGKDYYFKHYSGTPNKTELLIQIINHAIRHEGEMVSVYYVMNAANEAEAVRCITDYAMSNTDIFKKVNVEDIRRKYRGGTTKRRRQRQIKKRKTVSKKMDIKIFSKHIS